MKKKSLIKLNWDDILVKAAECGIRPNDFWNMTWKDFSIISKGKERNELNEWARTRNLAYIIYLSSTTEKSPKSLKSSNSKRELGNLLKSYNLLEIL